MITLVDTLHTQKKHIEDMEKQLNKIKNELKINENTIMDFIRYTLNKIRTGNKINISYAPKMFKDSFNNDEEYINAFMDNFFASYKKQLKNIQYDNSGNGIVFQIGIIWGQHENYDIHLYKFRLPLNWLQEYEESKTIEELTAHEFAF